MGRSILVLAGSERHDAGRMIFSMTPCLVVALVLLLVGCREPTSTSTPPPTATPTVVPSPTPPLGMPEMGIHGVQSTRSGFVVLLREKGTSRYLPIRIGPLEANAIVVELDRIDVPRPLTHDLLDSTISSLGGRVVYVIITDLLANIFYAQIILSKDGEIIEVDSRPSDALGLALRANVPVYADKSVLERAAFLADEQDGENGEAPRD